MNQYRDPDQGGNFDPNPMESLQLAQAISNVHLKLLLAEKRDIMLQLGQVESSYRHRKLGLKDYGFGPQRHVAVKLIKPREAQPNEADQSSVTQLILDAPTIRRTEANKSLLDIYRHNLEQNSPQLFDGNNIVDLSNPEYIPTRDVFGEAFNAEGQSIKFLLAPTGLHAYELPEDILPASPQLVAAGQQYIVAEGLGTYEAQMELMSQWFESTGELAELIRAYEPVLFEGTNGTNGSANSSVA